MTQRVNSNRIADNAVTAPKLSGGGVSTELIVDGAVTAVKIADSSITEIKIATDAVTSTKIATGAVTSTKVASGLLIPSGTVMLFVQTAAPTGWTKSTTHNDKALRVVSGAASSGGNTAFSATFVNRTPAGTVAVSGTNSGGAVSDSGLAESQLASHAHTEQLMSSVATMSTTGTRIGGSGSGTTNRTATSPTQGAGSGGAHGHGFTQPSWSGSGTFTGTALDFGVQYVDTIIATKD